MIGTNDAQLVGLRPENTVRNVRAIIHTIREASPETIVYAQSVLPSQAPRFNRWSEETNQGIRAVADGKSVIYLDLRPEFVRDGKLSNTLTSDGLHLNAA